MTDPLSTRTPVPGTGSLPADPLAGLRDWHVPDPVDWWPPAPGWWLLAGLVLGALALAIGAWLARRRRTAAARAALAQLAGLRAELSSGGDRRRFAASVSALLRRLALARYPRERVASLNGAQWLGFLDATGGGGGFCAGAGRVLAEAPYRAPGDSSGLDAAGLADLAARWIRANSGAHPRPGPGVERSAEPGAAR
jgi:hypothetical protein